MLIDHGGIALIVIPKQYSVENEEKMVAECLVVRCHSLARLTSWLLAIPRTLPLFVWASIIEGNNSIALHSPSAASSINMGNQIKQWTGSLGTLSQSIDLFVT